jgi:hypothetical protein
MLVRMGEGMKPYTLLVRMQITTVTIEISTEAPQKTIIAVPYDLALSYT